MPASTTNRKANMPSTLDLDRNDPVSCLQQEQLDKLDNAIPLAESLLEEMSNSNFKNNGNTFTGLDEWHRKLLKELLDFAELKNPVFEAMKVDPVVKQKHEKLRAFLADAERILNKIDASIAEVEASLKPLKNSKPPDVVEKTVNTIVNLFSQDQTLLPLVSERVTGLSACFSTKTHQLEDAVRSIAADAASVRVQCGSTHSTIKNIHQQTSQVVAAVQQLQNQSQRSLAEHQKKLAIIVKTDKQRQVAFAAHKATLDSTKQQALAYKSDLDNCRTLLAESEARTKRIAADLSKQAVQMSKMDADNKALTADCSSKASTIDGLEADTRDLATTKSALAEARHEIVELQDVERTLKQEITQLNEYVQQLEHRQREDAAEHNNINRSLVDLNRDHDNLIQEHRFLTDEVEELRDAKDELQEEKDRLLKELNSSKDQLSSIHEDNRVLRHTQIDAEGRISTLTADKQKLEQDIHNSRRERNDLMDNNAKLHEQIAEGDRDRATLNARLVEEQSSLASTEKIIKNLQSKILSLDEECQQQNAKFRECHQDLNCSEDELRRVREDRDQLQAQYQSLELDYNESVEDFDTKQNELDAANLDRRETSARLQESHESIVQLQGSIEDLRAKNQEQSVAMQEREEALQSASAAALEAKQQVEQLQRDLKQSRESEASLNQTIQELSPFRPRYEECLSQLQDCQITCQKLESKLKPMVLYQEKASRLPFYRDLLHEVVAPTVDQAVLSLVEESWPRIGATCNLLRSQAIDTASFVISVIHGLDRDSEDGCHDLLQSVCNLIHPKCNLHATNVVEIARQLRAESGYMVRLTITFMLCFLDRLRIHAEGDRTVLSSETSLVALRVFELVTALVRDPEILWDLSQKFSNIIDQITTQGLVSTSLFHLVRERLAGNHLTLAQILPNLPGVRFARKADLIMTLDGADLVLVRGQQDVALIPSENFDLHIDVKIGWQFVFDQDAPLLAGSRTPFWTFVDDVEEFRAVFHEILARKDMEEL